MVAAAAARPLDRLALLAEVTTALGNTLDVDEALRRASGIVPAARKQSALTLFGRGLHRLSGRDSQQEVEDGSGLVPVLGLGVLQVGMEDLEALGKGHAESADDVRIGRLGLLVGRAVQSGVGGELF